MATWPMATLGSGCSVWDKNHVILVIFEPPSKQSNAIFLAKFSTKYSKSSYSRGSWTVCEQEQNKDGQKKHVKLGLGEMHSPSRQFLECPLTASLLPAMTAGISYDQK